jgi:hypothetical protein
MYVAYRSSLIAVILLAQAADEAGEREPLIERLDPPTRARVILALAGLVLLGALMIGITWLVFRMIRGRIRDHRRIVEKQRQRAVDADDWAKKPLVGKLGEAHDDA